MKHDAITADVARLDAQAIAAQHIAALETVPLLTDRSDLCVEADRLLSRVRWFAGNGNAGMLGRNGLAPHIASIMQSAGQAGFDWRKRSAVA